MISLKTKIFNYKIFSKKHIIIYLFIIFILFINISSRYSSMVTEQGSDAFNYHRMTNAIIRESRIPWLLSPLSLWGIYPASDSSGVLVLLASFSIISNLNLYYNIFIYNIILIFFSIISFLILTLSYSKNPIINSISIISLTISPYFFGHTLWSLNERESAIPFIAIFILFFIILMRTGSEKKKFWPLVIIILIVGLSIHKIFLFIIPIFFIYSLIIIFYSKGISYSLTRKNKNIYILSIILFFSLLPFILNYSSLSIFNIYLQYQQSAIFSSTSNPFIAIINIPISIIGSVGIISFSLGIVGIIFLLKKNAKSKIELFILGNFLFLLPFVAIREYIKLVFAFYLSVLVIFCIKLFIELDPKKKNAILIVLILCCSIIIPQFTIWRKDISQTRYKFGLKDYIEPETFDCSLYLRNELNGPFISNNNFDGIKISALIDRPTISPIVQSAEENILYFSLYNISSTKKLNYSVTINNNRDDILSIYKISIDFPLPYDIITKLGLKENFYGIKIFILDKNFKDYILGYSSESIVFTKSIEKVINLKFKLYENNKYVIFYTN
jgi:hypothetical protein